MILKLSLNTSKSSWWYSEYPYTHHSLLGGTQTIPIHITDSLVVLKLYLYLSQSPRWYSDYPFTHHSLPDGTQTTPNTQHSLRGGPQTIPIHITVSFVVLSLSQNSSQSLWWHSDYPYTHHNLPGGSDNPYTHHSLPGGTQRISLRFTVSLVILRIPLYSSLFPW